MATRVLLLLIGVSSVTGSYLVSEGDKCAYKELPCESGQCVDRLSWCNGPVDCQDDSDEKYCRTFDPGLDADSKPSNLNECDESRYFQCSNGLCIPKAGRCNDMPDCTEGEDEENCDYLYDSDDSSESSTTTSAPSSTPTPTTHSSTPKSTTSSTISSPSATPLVSNKFAALQASRGDTSWIPSRFDVLRKSVRHVIEERDGRWGWGRATPRIATALYLANASYFDPENLDGVLTKKQLEVQLALDLMRNAEKPLRMPELAHYVHALLAVCVDPRDFHGVNVVRLLKKSVARRQSRGLFVSPLAHLALCNAGDLPDYQLRRLRNMAYRRNDEPRWLDVQTYALLTISCKTQQNSSSTWREWEALKKDVALNVSEWQQPDGSFGSVHSTGLALQALIAAEEPGTEEVKGRAMTHLLLKQDWQGSYGNELDNYYVLPALNGQSLASLHKRRCRHPRVPDTQGTEGVREASYPHPGAEKKQLTVHYSLWIGGGANEIQTVTLALPRHSDFLQVMESAEKVNPHFRHRLLTTGKMTTVHSIAGHASDIERSVYWTLYRKVPVPFRPKLTNVTATVARLKLLGAKRWSKDLRKLHPKDGEHLVFWYKPYL